MPWDWIFTAQVFEAAMLMCFGVSWPVAILKTWRARRVEGKSLVFLWCVFGGYVSGILHKVYFSWDSVVALYVFNALLVATDIVLYYRYRGRGASTAAV